MHPRDGGLHDPSRMNSVQCGIGTLRLVGCSPWSNVVTAHREVRIHQYDAIADLAELKKEVAFVRRNFPNFDIRSLERSVEAVCNRYVDMQQNIGKMMESAERGTFQDPDTTYANRLNRESISETTGDQLPSNLRQPPSISVTLKGKGLEGICDDVEDEAVKHLVAITKQRSISVETEPTLDDTSKICASFNRKRKIRDRNLDRACRKEYRMRRFDKAIKLEEHIEKMAPIIPDEYDDLKELLLDNKYGAHNASIARSPDPKEISKRVADFGRHGRVKRTYWNDVITTWHNELTPSILEFATWLINHSYPNWIWGQTGSSVGNADNTEYYVVAKNLISHVQGLSTHVLNTPITAEVVELLSVLIGPTRKSYAKRG